MDKITNRTWRLCGAGWVDIMLTKMNGITTTPGDVLANRQSNIFENWLMIESAQTGSMSEVYPAEVYSKMANSVDDFQFGQSVIQDADSPPVDFVVSGSTLTVDENVSTHKYKSGYPVKLWVWDSGAKTFTKSELTGVVAGGVVTFSAVPAGWYVCAVDNDGVYYPFCSVWKQVV